MSAFHRVDDIYSMDARKFFRFAPHLFGYRGALRSEAEKQSNEADNPPEKAKPTRDSNQWFLERQSAKSNGSSGAPDPGIAPELAQFMEVGNG